MRHSQIERKYREALNSEFERLRRVVPTLSQRDSSNLTDSPKPRKATVVASAIDYINMIKAERDRLLEENELLRGMRPRDVGAAANPKNYGPDKAMQNSALSATGAATEETTPNCISCGLPTYKLIVRHPNPKGNAGRPYYKCGHCGKFHGFADMPGIDPANPLRL